MQVKVLYQMLNDITVRVFFEKQIQNKNLCRLNKNYYYFCKSNIPVINLIVGSRCMIEVSKKFDFNNNKSHFHQIPTRS